MKKILLILALFCTSQSMAQFRYNRFGSRWLQNDNQLQINTHGGYNFLQEKNEYLRPIQVGLTAQLQYQFSRSHLIGGEFGWTNAKLNKDKIARVLDESPENYRKLKDMTKGNQTNFQIGINYSKIVNMKRCFLKVTVHGGINWNVKQTYSIELFDNEHDGFTNYTVLKSKGSTGKSAYSKIDCSFGIPIGRSAALVFGPQLFATTPSSTRNQYLEVENGYLNYAEVDYYRSSIVSLDFTIGLIISLDE